MDAALRTRLAELMGARAVDAGRDTVRPETADQVVMVCRVCAETDTALAVSSSGTGSAPAGGLLVSLERLVGISVEESAGVVRAEAGAAVEAVVAQARSVGLVPVGGGWAPPRSRHVGSLVGGGGVARRSLCGIEAVLATGERVRAGGGVLKDVAGYDLAGALIGSAGRAGIVTAVRIRLQPAGAAAAVEPVPVASAGGPLTELVRRAFDPHDLLRPAR